ncbi:MAG: Uma2 family endonuclease [Armatimonadetes bacterium]|nr:Uma2 family endonuclease [Armatimonadota bacterium]
MAKKTVNYPETDGKPMAETERHMKVTINTIYALRWHFRDRKDVYVWGNLFVYYEKGNPKKCVAPDTFVVFGVPNRERRVYLVWEEGKGLDVVFEFTSKKTRKEDFGRKMDIYRGILGVRELFIFDPLREYLVPPLVGYYRLGDKWVRNEPKENKLVSEVLGLEIVIVNETLRLYDLQTKTFLPTPDELISKMT